MIAPLQLWRGAADSRVLENQFSNRARSVSRTRIGETRTPLSNDPVRRAKQLENLRPAAALKHGATSERKLEPPRPQHGAPLLRRFPQLDQQRRGPSTAGIRLPPRAGQPVLAFDGLNRTGGDGFRPASTPGGRARG
jgi:hypothetical protein